jgi:hypothetical protein
MMPAAQSKWWSSETTLKRCGPVITPRARDTHDLWPLLAASQPRRGKDVHTI